MGLARSPARFGSDATRDTASGRRYTRRMKPCGSALCLAWVCIQGAFAAPAPTIPPQIPALRWEERSDWINVKTEVTHRHLEFRGFTKAGVLEDHADEGQALAETTFENCLFEECERGVAFVRFNDYDYRFDGCEFRRSTSIGSRAFAVRGSSVAPLTIQDCHVEGWRKPDGAVLLSRPPVLLFDCVTTCLISATTADRSESVPTSSIKNRSGCGSSNKAQGPWTS